MLLCDSFYYVAVGWQIVSILSLPCSVTTARRFFFVVVREHYFREHDFSSSISTRMSTRLKVTNACLLIFSGVAMSIVRILSVCDN